LLPVLLVGCGTNGPELAPVEGVVTFRGRPLVEAEVMFVPRQGGRPAVGRTDSQGRFQFTTFRERDGAPVGEYDVTVAKCAPDAIPPAPSLPSGIVPPANPISIVGPVMHKWLIPERYANAKTSRLSATVHSGKNAFSFELTP